MPIELKSLPKTARGRKSKYNFDKYFASGKVVGLVRGTEQEVEAGKADFTAKPESFRQTVMLAFKNSEVDGKLKTRIVQHEGKDILAIQVVPAGAEDESADEQGE